MAFSDDLVNRLTIALASPAAEAELEAAVAEIPVTDPTFSGTVTFSEATASTVPYLDASKVFTSSAVTPTELGYVHGVTSALQTQMNTKLTATQAANVAALAGSLTGTTTGTIINVAAAVCGGGATPASTDVDTCVAALSLSTNLALKELQVKLNAEIAALKATNVQASS